MPPSYEENWMPSPRKWTVKTIGTGTLPAGMVPNTELEFEGGPFKLTKKKDKSEWIPGATYDYDDLTDTLKVTKGMDVYHIKRVMVLTCTKQSGGVSWTAEEGG
jgi:hypothetical protein